MKYAKLYHYSPIANLTSINPNFYGSGVTRGAECKRGKTGLNKSYFYTRDEPEACVKTSNCYEIYIPYQWKDLIYDRGLDPENLYDAVKSEIRAQFHREPYEYELKDGVEQRIFELGYKGWQCSTSPQLPHALVLFEEVSTGKPKGKYSLYSWAGDLIEKTASEKILANSHGCRFFSAKETEKNSFNFLHLAVQPRQLPRVIQS